ncbi:MAG: hypothetical protein U0132_03340 [Gemmatimonadaceae bacterium]
MQKSHRALWTAASMAVLAACSTAPDASPSLTGPLASGSADAAAVAATRFDCVQTNLTRYYAIYHARGVLVGNAPGATRVFRPYVGDTLSVRPTAALVSAAKYPAPQPGYNTWNVTGGPAKASGDLFFLLFPQALPGPGGVFPAQLHVWYNGGQWGWAQSSEMCTVS